MGKYKWLGVPPLGKGVFRCEGKDYYPGDIMPEMEPEVSKSLLKKGKIEPAVAISEAPKVSDDWPIVDLTNVGGISEALLEKLIGAGYETANAVVEVGKDKLVEIDGIGKPTAAKLIEVCFAACQPEKDGE